MEMPMAQQNLSGYLERKRDNAIFTSLVKDAWNGLGVKRGVPEIPRL